jgi:acetylornithine deacetylase/succinyl-diaminopimelate desuccinylase-like protein
MKDISIDQNYLLEVTQNLIRIDTVNHPGRDNDYWPSIRYLQGLMEELGLEVVIEGSVYKFIY